MPSAATHAKEDVTKANVPRRHQELYSITTAQRLATKSPWMHRIVTAKVWRINGP
jgi:hypothetical protein